MTTTRVKCTYCYIETDKEQAYAGLFCPQQPDRVHDWVVINISGDFSPDASFSEAVKEQYGTPLMNAWMNNIETLEDAATKEAGNKKPVEDIHTNQVSTVYREDDIELQLLFVVMENAVLIKCEQKPEGVFLTLPTGLDSPKEETIAFEMSNPVLWNRNVSFETIRAAVDALDEKPVPRIEREIDEDGEEYFVIYAEGDQDATGKRIIDALSQLAGKPLPIWTPKKGEWKRLPDTSMYMGDPLESIGISIWRYTRRRAK